MATFVICCAANKLKHIALREIHYITYKIKKTQEVFNVYKNWKKDSQNFLNIGFTNFWLYDYSHQFCYNDRKRKRKYIIKLLP